MLNRLMIVFSFSAVFLTGCPQPTEPVPPPPTEYVTIDSSQDVWHTGATGNVDVTLDLSSTKNVYLVLTTTGGTSPRPTISSASMRAVDIPHAVRNSAVSMPAAPVSGSPEVTKSNLEFSRKISTVPTSRNLAPAALPTPTNYTVGTSTKDFITANASSGYPTTLQTIDITLRRQVLDIATDQGTRSLFLWVQDSFWDSTGLVAGKVNDSKLAVLSDKFLIAGDNNDIYDWVTDLYGPEWGNHSYPGTLVSGTGHKDVHIVIWDIDGDSSPTQLGGVVGYFWSKDNFVNEGAGGWNFSNQMINFSLDAHFFAKEDGPTWEATDYWPSTCISTLAHEFQHMINWYQGPVLDSTSPPTWLNEMASMVTEDLVANKILSDGPRGVLYSTQGAGTSGNTNGRLPLFNYFNDVQLTAWYSGNDVFKSYSISYAFGAWLSRNFGGADLFQKFIQAGGDLNALLGAVNANNGALPAPTLAELMEQWGASVILSSSTSTTVPYRHNFSTYQNSAATGTTFNLGGVNLFNYTYSGQAGPYFWPASQPGYATSTRTPIPM